MSDTELIKHPHCDGLATKAATHDDDAHLTTLMCAVMVSICGNLAVKTPSPCTKDTGYCPHGGCPDIITKGSDYNVTSCFLVPSSSDQELDSYLSYILSKGVKIYFPALYNYTLSYHTIHVTNEIITSNMFPTIVGTSSLNQNPNSSFIVDLTGRNHFKDYKHGFDEEFI